MDDQNAPEHLTDNVVYFNGFGMGIGSSDITIQLHLDNKPIVELKASYTTAKTFAMSLMATVQRFEKMTTHDILTINEVGESMRKESKEKDSDEGAKV